MEESFQPCYASLRPNRNVRNYSKDLLVLCLIGTCIAVCGAALRTTGVQFQEDLGFIIHDIGMVVMLIGFCGLFLRRFRFSSRSSKQPFSWSDKDDKLTIVPSAANEVLNISLGTVGSALLPELKNIDLNVVRCLVARGQSIDSELIERFAKLQQLRVIDFQKAALNDGVLHRLESLESLELLLLAGCLEPIQTKGLRMALPEAKMVFDPR